MSYLVVQTCVYSFIMRGMSDLVVFIPLYSCATLVFILLYWEEFYSFILRGMSDLVVQYLCLFFYTERNEWFNCAILVWFSDLVCNTCVYSFILRGMSDLVVQHWCLFLYTERNEWFNCYTERNEWFSCAIPLYLCLFWEEWVI